VMQRLEVEEKVTVARRQVRIYPYVKRAFDIVTAAMMLAFLWPFLLTLAVVLAMQNKGRVFRYTPKTGRYCRPFNEYAFDTDLRLIRKLPVLVNLLKGDVSLIGPRATSPGEMCPECRHMPLARQRDSVRPGLICDWWIRRHASLDYVREILLDAAYVESLSFRKDVSIVFRALPGLITTFIWGDEPPEYASRISILDVKIDNLSMQSAIDRIMQMLDQRGTRQACFINPHYINEAFRVPEFKAVLDDASLVLADGFGTRLAGKILHRPIRQNLCGTDLFPRLCAALSNTGKSIYLLGAAPGAAENVAK
jgi:N-acetylglucosaminyldiphosphoundecaprenol N-acetyl-beta-D-mannosaminyltransferase